MTFTDWIAKAGFTPESLGVELEVTGQTVRNWINGNGKPRVETAIRIEDLSQGAIPVRYWAGERAA